MPRVTNRSEKTVRHADVELEKMKSKTGSNQHNNNTTVTHKRGTA